MSSKLIMCSRFPLRYKILHRKSSSSLDILPNIHGQIQSQSNRTSTSIVEKITLPRISEREEKEINSNVMTYRVRGYHTTRRNENSAFILSLGTVALTAKAAQLGLRAFDEWKKNIPEDDASPSADAPHDSRTKEKKTSSTETGQRENFFDKWFGTTTGAKFYEGGFEEEMTRREAALILGVRESTSAKRIRDAHKRLLVANHPDTGGSTYITSKLNEAKELLLKGKSKM